MKRSVGGRWYTCTMLTELRVESLLLIESAHLRFCAGLNVLTGETGAGKTVLAHALDLLLGGRPRQGIVRPGAAEAYVEGAFSVPACLAAAAAGDLLDGGAQPASADGEVEILLGRRVFADGRTRAYVNGRTATVADLRDLGAELIAFYGQHEHRRLTLAAAQLDILDGLCGARQQRRRAECAATLGELREAERELARLRDRAEADERELELLEHEIAEIERVDPRRGEHAELAGERERLRKLDALRAAADCGASALTGDDGDLPGAIQLIAEASARIDALAGVDARLDAIAGRFVAMRLEAQDLAGELRSRAADLDAEEASLEFVEERLTSLERLMRRHGGDEDALLAYHASAIARRGELASAEHAAAEAAAARDAADRRLRTIVAELRAARERAASKLGKAVRAQLAELAMPSASFEVKLEAREPIPTGGDEIEMVLSANPGVPAGPLREIASGGELSRIMLALMSVASDFDPHRALIFDEIDAGIGGHTARAVGERLRALSRSRQVICITHLPQVASFADRHFTICKDAATALATAEVDQLADGEVVGELVRMLGASAGDAAARRHAEELLKAA